MSNIFNKWYGVNKTPVETSNRKENLHWSDKTVCKYFLCGFCPIVLFKNSKADLGNCPFEHIDDLRNKYEESKEHGKLGYEEKFHAFLHKILNDCERKISLGQRKLYKRKLSVQIKTQEEKESYERITNQLHLQNSLVLALSQAGDLEYANATREHVKELQRELADLTQSLNSRHAYPYNKQLDVCSVCGSIIMLNDLPEKTQQHLSSPEHIGFSIIRSKIQTMHIKAITNSKSIKEKETNNI